MYTKLIKIKTHTYKEDKNTADKKKTKKIRKREEREKKSIKPGRVLRTPKLSQQLIAHHRLALRVSDVALLQHSATPKIALTTGDSL